MSSRQKTIMTHLEVGTKLDFTSSGGSMKLYFIVLPNSVSALFGSADSVASLSTRLVLRNRQSGSKDKQIVWNNNFSADNMLFNLKESEILGYLRAENIWGLRTIYTKKMYPN